MGEAPIELPRLWNATACPNLCEQHCVLASRTSKGACIHYGHPLNHMDASRSAICTPPAITGIACVAGGLPVGSSRGACSWVPPPLRSRQHASDSAFALSGCCLDGL